MDKEPKKIPAELITPEMREAGVDENTEFATHEEMVEKIGEEKVAEIEKAAESAGPDKDEEGDE